MNLEENPTETVEETAPVEAVVETAVETPAIEPVASEDTAPVVEEPKPRKADPLIGEITRQRSRAREAEGKAERFERELTEAKALIERMATKDGQPRSEPRAAQLYQPSNEDERIRAGVAKAMYDQRTQEIYDRGQVDFGAADFNEAATNFAGTVGDGLVPLVSDIMDIAGSASHKVIYELSADPARAIAIRDMPLARRAIAIHKMVEMSEAATTAPKSPLAAPAPKVSKAPPPPPRIQATTNTEKPKGHWWSDKTSEEDFDKHFWENQKARKGMHR